MKTSLRFARTVIDRSVRVRGGAVRSVLAWGAACLVATQSCGGGGGGDIAGPQPVASVTVAGSSTLVVGETTSLAATALSASGQPLTGRTVAWSSSEPAIANVNATTGLVTAIAAGSATITATIEGKTGTLTEGILPQPVASVLVATKKPSLAVGDTTTLIAAAVNANGLPLTGRVVAWTSSAPTIATVNGTTGLVTAVSVGSATISATVEGKIGTVTLTIVSGVPVSTVTLQPSSATLLVGQTVALTATTRDASGNIVTGRLTEFFSTDTTIATVSAAGLVTARGTGKATVTAVSEGKSGSAAITVTPEATSTLSYGTTTQRVALLDTDSATTPTVTYKDALGVSLPATSVRFASRSSTIATVDANGRITARSPGQVWVAATNSDGSASDSVYVIVPIHRLMPIVRTDLTEYAFTGGDTIRASVVLDPHGGTVAGATVGLSLPTAQGAFTAFRVEVPSTSPQVVVTPTAFGALRATVATATGFTAPYTLMRLVLISRAGTLQRTFAGWLDVTIVDASAVDGSSLTSQTTSTRYPIILR